MRILIVEDEKKLADLVSNRLKKEKYSVDIFNDGEDGLLAAETNIYDLIILDVMLPSINGFEILKNIRKENIESKIIMLTAKSMLEDKLEGFEYGANDYLAKPFHMEELVARVNAQLRIPEKTNNQDFIEFGDIKLNLKNSNLECIKTNESVNIINKEFLILEYFMQMPGQIISRDTLYDKVWGLENEAESNNLEAYLSFIRKKLKSIGSNVQIKAVRGLGYKLEK